MTSIDDLKTSEVPNWCPGCGNYGILTALKMAVSELGIPAEKVVLTGGIGCSSKIPQWVRVNGFCGLHGRTVPLAEGIKLANPELTVIATGGDGDGYAEGTNHFIHLMQNNINVKYFVHDNQIYGLTKGQASPTSDEGFITKTTPWGAVKSLNPITVALAAGGTFVARGYANDAAQLKELMKKAIQHKGAALIDILQPCVTFNHQNTHSWYKEKIHYLDKPFKTRAEALTASLEWGNKIPCGVFYETTEKTLDDVVPKPATVKARDITKLMKELI